MKNKLQLPTNRNFGIVFFVFFLIISIWPLFYVGEIRLWSIFIALIFLILGLINSKILTPLNKLWFNFGLFLGKIVSPLVMGIIFYAVVTPTGILLRLIGKDILSLKFNKKNSYWIKKDDLKSKMKNQF
tara:strand:+ start:7088 stop:7474 length:387 start_codon:yes stop_codon:yes gene_type:complete